MKMETLEKAWQRISARYRANTPAGTFVLAPSATKEIVRLETELGFRLPEDLRDSFALHNGTLDAGYLLHHGALLSLTRILEVHRRYIQWQTNAENWGLGPDYKTEYIIGPINPIWWTPTRLALTDNNGDCIMSDFDPTPGGTIGQNIEFDHEIGPRSVLAPSFEQWINEIAERLENGEYVYYEEELTVAASGI